MSEKHRRRYESGPGFVRAKECPNCGHTRCGEGCVCNCDAAHAEHEGAYLRAELERLGAQPPQAVPADVEDKE